MFSSTRGRSLLLGSLAIAAGLGACVLPSEFDDIATDCIDPKFDAATRGSFCSGSVSSRVVDETASPEVAARPLVEARGGVITTLEQTGADAFRLRVISEGESAQFPFTLPSQGALTSFAVMGLNEGAVADQSAVIAMVYDAQDVRFVPLSDAVGGISVKPPTPYVDADHATQLATSAGCEATGENPFLLTDMAAMDSSTIRDRRYLMVAARCALVVYAQHEDRGLTPEPFVLAQYRIQAHDIEIDRVHDKMYIASGLDGLQVRSLRAFEQELDGLLDAAYGFAIESEPGAANNGGAENPDDLNNNPPRDGLVFTPEQLPAGDHYINDPVKRVSINVVGVSFSQDRIFYLNGPTTDAGADGGTYLVSGVLTDDGVLVDRQSIQIAGPAGDKRFEWGLVGLGDSMAMVLGNEYTQVGDREAVTSRLVLFDAPRGQSAVPVHEIGVTTRVSAIAPLDGELLIVQPDRLTAYDIELTGSHL